MNTAEALFAILVQLGWVAGVQFAIWWPRKAERGTARARAYRAVRAASGCLSLGYLLFLLHFTVSPQDDPSPFTPLTFLTLGNLLLTPLSSLARNLDRGKRVRAMLSGVWALVFAACMTWTCVFFLIRFLTLPGVPRLQWTVLVAATLLCGAAMAFVMEAYAAIRQPRLR